MAELQIDKGLIHKLGVYNYGKRISTNDWLPRDWKKCTLPILEGPGKNFDEELRGTAFLLKYNNVIFVITARHVIEDLKNGRIAVPQLNKIWTSGSFQNFEKHLRGVRWILHPEGLDLVAIPFVSTQDFDVMPIDEQYWNLSPTIELGDCITHLGYPDKQHANYSDGTLAFYAVEMPGKIIETSQDFISTRSAGLHGASGGPLFLRRKGKSPLLIGVITTAKKKKNEFLYKTASISILNIIVILDSVEMKKQVEILRSYDLV